MSIGVDWHWRIKKTRKKPDHKQCALIMDNVKISHVSGLFPPTVFSGGVATTESHADTVLLLVMIIATGENINLAS